MRHYTGNVPKNELRECQIGGGTRFRGTIPGPVFWLRENPVIDNWELLRYTVHAYLPRIFLSRRENKKKKL